MSVVLSLPLALATALLLGCGIKAMPRPPQQLNEPPPPNVAGSQPDAGCPECHVTPQNP
jgi:hypothetical protein